MTALEDFRIGVVGAGLMGAEIAFVHALAGHQILADRGEEALSAAMTRLAGVLDKGISPTGSDSATQWGHSN